MIWNWQQPKWPQFEYDQSVLVELEARFLRESGYLFGTLAHIAEQDKAELTVETMSEEALKTSEIEGDYLDRNSLQSSIRKNLYATPEQRKVKPAEQGVADMMTDLYQNFSYPLIEETLWIWHQLLMKGNLNIKDVGAYRTHTDSMQVVSGALHKPKIHFEAPPSAQVPKEMERFIDWYNHSAPGACNQLSALTRAGIAHIYFVCIHPFEDGNGRIGRALIVKALSESVHQPLLIGLSYTIQKNRKLYYKALEENNKELNITSWLLYFSNTILEALNYTQRLIDFIIEKGKLYNKINGQLNYRQEKALATVFQFGPDGFEFGLSAEKYISITGTSRATATRDLQDMVDKGVFTRTGELKSTRYHLNIGK